MSDNTASLTFSDGSPGVTFPVLKGTVGPDVIDIRTLYGKTGKFTFDPGFLSTASCNSTITFIDGDNGELLYRGYPIDELAVKCDFMEVCHLLLYGELPNVAQKKDFVGRVTKHTMVNEQMQFFMRGFRRDAHPMAVLTGLVGAMSAFYPDSINLHDAHQRDISAIRLIRALSGQAAEVPVIVLTADASERIRDELRDAGADDYLAKPFKLKVLLALVLHWISDDQPRRAKPSGALGPPVR